MRLGPVLSPVSIHQGLTSNAPARCPLCRRCQGPEGISKLAELQESDFLAARESLQGVVVEERGHNATKCHPHGIQSGQWPDNAGSDITFRRPGHVGRRPWSSVDLGSVLADVQGLMWPGLPPVVREGLHRCMAHTLIQCICYRALAIRSNCGEQVALWRAGDEWALNGQTMVKDSIRACSGPQGQRERHLSPAR